MKRQLGSLVVVVVLAASSLLTGTQARANNANKPNVYLVAIGVSEFLTPTKELADPKAKGKRKLHDLRNGVRFAAKDARELSQAFQMQQGKLFNQVSVNVLTNRQASRKGIAQAMDWLKRQPIRPIDYVVVFVAGHGSKAGNTPFDDDWSAAGLVPWTTYINTLATLRGTRFLLLDTCHSASAGLNPITKNTGIITVSACMAQETSQELNQLRNGLFTAAFLHGLSGKADVNKDGYVTLAELVSYVDNNVRAMTRNKQKPTVQLPASIPLGLPVAWVKK